MGECAALLRIVHLSDLHLGADDATQRPLFGSLAQALRGQKADLVVFTGDVFDGPELGLRAIEKFEALLDAIDAQVGPNARTLIQPGNHDRRSAGSIWPHVDALFLDLKARLASRPNVQVLGVRAPFLAEVVPIPGFPAHVVAYDSTYLPRGLFSAGGLLRQEDLLQAAEHLLVDDGKPMLFLLHHHLVPTPITDVGEIVVHGRGRIVQALVKHALPWLVPNADREEITMTALGAGSALTTLHTLGRAVMVLHGHKHYPTARLLKGTGSGEGDVLVLGAGSCGTSEQWAASTLADAPKLWPSFNVVELDGAQLRAQSVAFPPEVGPEVWDHPPRVNKRSLVRAKRDGKRWELDETPVDPRPFEASLALNAATVALLPSERFLDRFDLEVSRRVNRAEGATLAAYHELVEGPSHAEVVGTSGPTLQVPADVPLPLDADAQYRVVGGVCATVREASAEYREPGSAFEWVGLMNRYRAEVARLVVTMKPVDVAAQRPFASVIDLTTGREKAVVLERDDAARTYRLEVKQCPARTMLRIYWPLVAG